MIEIILTSALGATVITGVVFFWQLRRGLNRLNEQITQIRVEIARDTALRQLTEPTDESATPNGNGSSNCAVAINCNQSQQPARAKGHLRLFTFGVAAALLAAAGAFLREAWRTSRAQVIGATVAATAAATTVTLLTVTPWSNDADVQPPTSAPTAIAPATPPPSTREPEQRRQPQPEPTTPSVPSASPSPTTSASGSASPSVVTPTPSPTPTASTVPVAQQPSPTPSAAPSSEGERSDDEEAPEASAPGPGETPAGEEELPPLPSAEPSPASPKLCLDVTASPLPDLDVCLLGDG